MKKDMGSCVVHDKSAQVDQLNENKPVNQISKPGVKMSFSVSGFYMGLIANVSDLIVLPVLGKEYIPEMVVEELATDVLENKFPFQTFFSREYK